MHKRQIMAVKLWCKKPTHTEGRAKTFYKRKKWRNNCNPKFLCGFDQNNICCEQAFSTATMQSFLSVTVNTMWMNTTRMGRIEENYSKTATRLKHLYSGLTPSGHLISQYMIVSYGNIIWCVTYDSIWSHKSRKESVRGTH